MAASAPPYHGKSQEVALFSSQITNWTRETLKELQSTLLENPDLQFLTTALAEIPSLWTTIEEDLGLSDFGGEDKLFELRDFAIGKDIPNPQSLTNTHFAPLTVALQVAELTRLGSGQRNGKPLPDFFAAQGFCIGFLSAAAFASSNTWADFENSVPNVLRLATCIGAVVDAENSTHSRADQAAALSVRWKVPSDNAYLEAALDSNIEAYISCFTDERTITITLPNRNKSSLCSRLSNAKIAVTELALSGNYHHPRHNKTAQRLKDICAKDHSLQLPNATKLRLPLRSTADADVVVTGSLDGVAIDTILCKRAHWFETVRQTVDSIPGCKVNFVPLGHGFCIPRSLSISKAGNVDNKPRQEIDAEPLKANDEIAVIGMACRFPQADSLEEFWQLIVTSQNATSKLPTHRFNTANISRKPTLPNFWGNFLRRPDVFDHRFFGVSGREAKSMDPQQRIALEVAYEALESSGYHSLPGRSQLTDVGCYIGAVGADYEDNVASENANAFAAIGTLRAFISGRISHFFGWTGPSIVLDTACSSSAVAIHTACRALISGECAMALAGGVNVISSNNMHQNLAAGSFLNPNGSSRAFDAAGAGYCRGEGAGMLVLKPLSKALAEGDTIFGVISSTGVNQNTNLSSITVPDSTSQSSLYKKALSMGCIDPQEVTYVEAHGTGTPVGDPIEYESVRTALTGPWRTSELFLGSVKDNIGHLEAASGVAGVIKTLLMMQHKIIPKQANFVSLNPNIRVSPTDCITVPKTAHAWNNRRRVALVNNYGAAGSNAAIVLREHSDLHDAFIDIQPGLLTTTRLPAVYPIFLSAKSSSSLKAYTDTLKLYLSKTRASLADVAYNLAQTQNSTLEHRAVFIGTDAKDLISHISSSVKNSVNCPTAEKRPVVLSFGGQTGKKVTISKELYDNCDILRKYLIQCENVCKSLGIPSILAELFHGEIIEDLVVLHCALLSVQVSSAKCWIDCGLNIDTLIGHSFGQITALCIANSISLEDAFRFVSGRARLIKDKWGSEPGVMMSLECDRRDLEIVVDRINSTATFWVDVACYNGSHSFVLAGDRPSMEKVEAECRSYNIRLKLLENSHAYHSYVADGILDDLQVLADSIQIRPPRIPVETCSLDGSWTTFTADKLVQHTRQPVYFHDAVQRIASRFPSAIWVEAGSASPVLSMVRRVLRNVERSDTLIAMDLSGVEALKNLSNAACQLWKAGYTAAYWPFHRVSRQNYTRINLPPYQFEQTRHWIELKPRSDKSPVTNVQTSSAGEPKLLTLVQNDQQTGISLFSVDTSHAVFNYATRGHAVTGQSLCPAPMYLELATRSAIEITQHSVNKALPHIEDLVMSAPLGLDGTSAVSLRLCKVAQTTWNFTVFSQSSDSQGTEDREIQHASGRIRLLLSNDIVAESQLKMLKKIFRSSGTERILTSPSATGISGPIVYTMFADVVKYANYYRGIKSLSASENEAVGLVMVPAEKPCGFEAGTCDPITIDNFLQVAGIHINCLSHRKDGEVLMCTGVDEIIFSAPFTANRLDTRSWTVYTRYESALKSTSHDIFVYDAVSKDLVFAIMGANFTRVPYKSLARSLARLNAHDSTLANLGPENVNEGGKQTNEKFTLENQSGNNFETFRDSGYTTREGTPPQTPPLGIGYEKKPSTLPSIPDQKLMKPLSQKLQTQQRSQGSASASDTCTMLVCEMFSSIMEIPIKEVKPTSDLTDLGVDSLLATEVLAEIQQRFNVSITQAQFLGCTDILSLCRLIRPNEPQPVTCQSTTSAHGSDISDEPTAPRTSSASEILLNGLSVSKGDVDRNLAVVGRDCFIDIKSSLDQLAESTSYANFCSEVFILQSDLVVQYVVEAFAELGSSLKDLDSGAEVPVFPFDSKQQNLVSQLYKILCSAGLVEIVDNGIHRRTTVPVPSTTATALFSQMLEQFPKHASETKLLHIMAHRLADILRGTADPLALMFQDAEARNLLEDVYANAPMFKTITLLLSQYLVSVISQFDDNREIKILEIGAGTGGTTRHLCEAITSVSGERSFTYTFTDLSPSLVAAARRKFSKQSFMRYATLDVEQDPSPQFEGVYDIIISTNCIHATKDLVQTTTNIRKMLRPDGVLCLVEATRNLFWYDLVWGPLDGWWLFNDGREHALADELHWARCLRAAGFEWVDWSDSASAESDLLRIISASPFNAGPSTDTGTNNLDAEDITETSNGIKQTLTFKSVDGLDLLADIYYPLEMVDSGKRLPVALMIHGGGHVMLSRNDVRPKQTEMLLNSGFLPVSIDYRLCPEMTLIDGPMTDVGDALAWIRHVLPKIPLSRTDVRINGEKVVCVGWSTGGHLAMSLAWTSIPKGVRPPDAILAFYSPSDYEDPFWTRPNVPAGSDTVAEGSSWYDLDNDIWAAVSDRPITKYNVPRTKRALGGWMAPTDPRSRLVLHMNWHGRTLNILLNGLDNTSRHEPSPPKLADILAVSPLAQIRKGNYRTPTFIVHPRQDDLIPWQQAERTWRGLCDRGVESELRIVEGVPHLFDLYRENQSDPDAMKAVKDGYHFLCKHAGLQ